VHVRAAYATGGLVEQQARNVGSDDDRLADQVIEIRSGGSSARVRSSRQQARELVRILDDVARGTIKR
jgi:hypothetical protein